MSTVRLLKDADGQKAGAVISVPYVKGLGMVKAGLAEYPQGQPLAKAAPPDPAVGRRITALEKENVELKRHAVDLEKENAELKELLAIATKPDPPKK